MRISSIVATPNGLAAIHKDGEISYGDVEHGEWGQWEAPDIRPDRVLCAAALDERCRVLGTTGGKLIWQVRNVGFLELTPAPLVSGIEAIAAAYAPDGPIIVTGHTKGSVGAFQLETGHPNASVGAFEPSTCEIKLKFFAGDVPVKRLALSPDGKFAVSGSAADHLTLWRLPELTRIADFHCDGKIEDIALAAEASLVIVADGAGSVHLLSAMHGPVMP